MKALKDMSNVEKGKLLAELFPDKIPGILDYIDRYHYDLVEKKDMYSRNWNKNHITVEDWYAMAHDVFSRVVQQKKQMIKRSKRFADQLFDSERSQFTIRCIVRYADDECRCTDFYYVVTALFDSDWAVIE